MAPRAPLPPAGECLGGLSVGAGQQPLASVRPGQILVRHTEERGLGILGEQQVREVAVR